MLVDNCDSQNRDDIIRRMREDELARCSDSVVLIQPEYKPQRIPVEQLFEPETDQQRKEREAKETYFKLIQRREDE
jgi:hypothetical protein